MHIQFGHAPLTAVSQTLKNDQTFTQSPLFGGYIDQIYFGSQSGLPPERQEAFELMKKCIDNILHDGFPPQYGFKTERYDKDLNSIKEFLSNDKKWNDFQPLLKNLKENPEDPEMFAKAMSPVMVMNIKLPKFLKKPLQGLFEKIMYKAAIS